MYFKFSVSYNTFQISEVHADQFHYQLPIIRCISPNQETLFTRLAKNKSQLLFAEVLS